MSSEALKDLHDAIAVELGKRLVSAFDASGSPKGLTDLLIKEVEGRAKAKNAEG